MSSISLAEAGQLTGLPGMGDKKLENLRKSLAFREKEVGRVALGVAWPLVEELLAEADMVAPVPLHWTRLWTRRYNQAALLGRAAAAEAKRPFLPDLLIRGKRTPPQKSGRAARARNVAGAFSVPGRRRRDLEGRRVLLVDDVRTTGATLEGCARALKAAGATGVDVLTLALVVRPREMGR